MYNALSLLLNKRSRHFVMCGKAVYDFFSFIYTVQNGQNVWCNNSVNLVIISSSHEQPTMQGQKAGYLIRDQNTSNLINMDKGILSLM